MHSEQVGQSYIIIIDTIYAHTLELHINTIYMFELDTTVLEIDAVGSYNMCKAVYDHYFKVYKKIFPCGKSIHRLILLCDLYCTRRIMAEQLSTSVPRYTIVGSPFRSESMYTVTLIT